MNVVILNHSDSRGGASVTSVRLMQALVRLGVDARMLVVHNAIDSERIGRLQPRWRVRTEFLAEHADIWLRQGCSRTNLFAISTGSFGMPVHEHPWVKEADIVVLAWVNQGMLSLSEIKRIKAPVAWVMHDMWCFTGVCHHAGECRRFQQECGQCQLLVRKSAHDLSWHVHRSKQRLYGAKPIRFVAVSTWLASLATSSSLASDMDVCAIPNPFPVENFTCEPRIGRRRCGLPGQGRLIVMAAARLDDPVKGLPRAIEALNMIADTDAVAVFVGNLRDKQALDSLRLPHVWIGPVSEQQMRDIYPHADVVLSSSEYETLPTTLIEGMASGCVAVTTGRGGQSDIVDHLDTGYVAPTMEAADLAAGLRWALACEPQRRHQHQAMMRFAADKVARRYIDLFEKMLNR